jgi:hypothetical protein
MGDLGVKLRDEIEETLRRWNIYELERRAPAVIDFDCSPRLDQTPIEPLDRVATLHRLNELWQAAIDSGNNSMAERVDADIAYLEALLGRRETLEVYVRRTQGCGIAGWSDAYIEDRGEVVKGRLRDYGISWDGQTMSHLEEKEGRLDLSDARDAISTAASSYEPSLRALCGSNADFDLSIEVVSLDEYWSYWVDGVGSKVRLRINLKNSAFTQVQAVQFAIHEVLGHGLQCASFSQSAVSEPSRIRLTSVHSQQQVLLEGLAQALPLFIAKESEDLNLRVYLSHYLQLVTSELHLALNRGDSISDCIAAAKRKVPFWSDERIGDILCDRSVNPLFRSYMWSYPAGIDWFLRLSEARDTQLESSILTAAYRTPLTPADLEALWPSGPQVGGAVQP